MTGDHVSTSSSRKFSDKIKAIENEQAQWIKVESGGLVKWLVWSAFQELWRDMVTIKALTFVSTVSCYFLLAVLCHWRALFELTQSGPFVDTGRLVVIAKNRWTASQ